MPDYKCIRETYTGGKLWKKGQVKTADKCPNRHFKPVVEENAEGSSTAPTDINALRAQAKELGIKLKRGWSAAEITAAIAAAESGQDTLTGSEGQDTGSGGQ